MTSVPDGFRLVSKVEFFAALDRAASDDPMPNNDRPDVTIWKCQRNAGRVFGYSWPGWKNPQDPEAWAIHAA